MKDLIFKLWSSKKIRYTVIIGFASLVAYLLGKQILKYYGVKPSKKDKRDYRISGVSADSVFPSKYKIEILGIKDQGRVNSCHDEKTEVLTRNGWKYFKDISFSDLLASANPDDGSLIFEHPVNIIKQKYTGKMICGIHKRLDFMVTPNHKMIVRKWIESERVLSDKYTSIDASELGWCVGLRNSFYQHKENPELIIIPEEKVSNGNILPRMEIKLSDWVKFVGIYLAEGTLLDPNRHYPIQIAAVKERERAFIENLFDSMGIHGVSSKDRYVISNKRIWSLLAGYGLYKVKSFDKFIPDFIFDLDHELIKDFLYAFAMGDGHFMENGGVRYATSSPIMAEQLRILMIMSGSSTTMFINDNRGKKCSMKDGREIIARHIGYVINQWKTNRLSIEKKGNIKEVDYDGYVYCAEVPTYHTLITRRNGKILFSGNCCAHSMASVSEWIFKRSGNYEKDRFSVGFIYGYRPSGYYTGEGMFPREALKTIKDVGMVRHTDFPYNEEVPNMTNIVMANLDTLKTKAATNKSAVYFQLKTEDEIKTCLMNYGPVSIMYPVTDEFEAPVNGKIEVNGLKNFVGYHQVTLFGWEGPYWLMVNSWGEGWGNKGTALVSFKYPWNEAWGFSTDPLAAIKRKTFIPKIRFWFANLF